MKKLFILAAALSLVTGAAMAADNAAAPKAGPAGAEAKAPAKTKCDDCPMDKKLGAKKCGGVTCPEKIKGAETVSRNIGNGVEISITAKDPGTAAQIQELALVHYGPGAEKCPGCPTAVPGAETKVENVQGGVKVTVTGKTPGTVGKIQEASAREHAAPQAAAPKGPAKARAAHMAKAETAAAKRYVCPMGDYEGDKPGKCPKCGMTLVEKK